MPKKLKTQLRQLHRALAPVMLLPIVLTVITGVVYQLFDLAGKGGSVVWLLDLHKGRFGVLHLDKIYPFLNGLGSLVLAVTGITMWLQMRVRNNREA